DPMVRSKIGGGINVSWRRSSPLWSGARKSSADSGAGATPLVLTQYCLEGSQQSWVGPPFGSRRSFKRSCTSGQHHSLTSLRMLTEALESVRAASVILPGLTHRIRARYHVFGHSRRASVIFGQEL